jgi:hypothetical protein
MPRTTDDDGIEMRVRHYAHYYEHAQHNWHIEVAADAPGHARQFIIVDTEIARVDGGDPGDENDGE